MKTVGGGRDLSGDIGGRTDNASCEANKKQTAPPPYKGGASRPSPYCLSVQSLQALKVDGDLDSCPPLQPRQQPLQTESSPQEADLPTAPPGPPGTMGGHVFSTRESSGPTTRSQTKQSLYSVHKEEDEGRLLGTAPNSTIQAPMMEVASPDGPLLVFRPWSPKEVIDYA